jgi:hypothetical protein
MEPKDITKAHVDDDKKEWKFCTKCVCKATKKQGFFQLSHFDIDHDPNFYKTKASTAPATSKAEVHLTRVDDPNGNIPLGPPFTTTLGPEGDENGDDDAMEFQGAWCCSFDLPPELRSGATVTVVRRVDIIDESDDDELHTASEDDSDDDSDHDSDPTIILVDDSDDGSDHDSMPAFGHRMPAFAHRGPVVEHGSSDDDSDHESMPVLGPRRDDSSSDEDDDDIDHDSMPELGPRRDDSSSD